MDSRGILDLQGKLQEAHKVPTMEGIMVGVHRKGIHLGDRPLEVPTADHNSLKECPIGMQHLEGQHLELLEDHTAVKHLGAHMELPQLTHMGHPSQGSMDKEHTVETFPRALILKHSPGFRVWTLIAVATSRSRSSSKHW